ncbi:FAD/NAD(P)-binding protein [Streptomyces aureus]|uniref:FAD/NAD(P)-binding protein n=1 Tax=Streptomyces aureus TaxID=193461 RepID=UPI000A81B987|nr:FAD/NAD(P)-binding protein [Streptomyces aureus]
MNPVRERHTVAIVGAGAAGALTAVQLCETAVRRRVPLALVLIDPAPEAGRGTAYATTDPRHRLNVPAAGMSCYPDDPGHFTRWLCRHGEPTVRGDDFATRYRYGAYLADTLARAIVRAHGTVAVQRLRTRAEACRPAAAGRLELRLADGSGLLADSVVLATGPAATTGAWAPPRLRTSSRFIGSPWAPGALDGPLGRSLDGRLDGPVGGPVGGPFDAPAGRGAGGYGPAGRGSGGNGPVGRGAGGPRVGGHGAGGPGAGGHGQVGRDAGGHGVGDDVLLVGTGLTAVDLALTLDRPGRTVHALSRTGLLPQPHALVAAPAMAAPEGLDAPTLSALRRAVYRHIGRAVRAHGDWRPALDSLRPHTARLWHSLTPEERAVFLREAGALWNTHRHRTAPATAESLDRVRTARRLRVHTGTVTDAVPRSDDSLLLTLSDGSRIGASWVIDCTGPGPRPQDPLWRSLFETGAAVPGPLGLGVATRDGRLLDAQGRTGLALFTLGAPRRGELWETTAVPEIRVQAAELAEGLLAPLAPSRRPARRRPLDAHGLPLSTHAEAAAAHRTGLERVLKVRAGAEDAFARAVALDPGFALGHAALALLGHECGADVDVPRALADARRCARERADERERSFVEVVTRRVRGEGSDGGAGALLGHLAAYPADALALAAAVPTIAFSGVGGLDPACALDLVERAAPAYGGHWFPDSLLAFLRQDQGRHDEAAELAGRALAAEPASGHAAHALAHVHYESGDHARGRDWLDAWVSGHGRGAVHRAHFSWHVALHELALDDPAAVRRRWFAQLAPGRVSGVRALVDSGSLLWRARLSDSWRGPVPAADVLDSVAREIVERPATAFTALHAAVALTAAGDLAALRRLRDHAAGADPVQREVVVPLCEALAALLEERFQDAARGLDALLPVLGRVGGSAAQREVVEETLLYALVAAGRCEAARRLLDTRLDRGHAPRDRRLLAALPG